MKSYAIKKLDYDLIVFDQEIGEGQHIASFNFIEDARILAHIYRRGCKGFMKYEIYFKNKLIETL